MNRILRSLVCVCVLAAGVLGQSNGDWFKSRVWDGVGGALDQPSVSRNNKPAEIRAEAFTAGNIIVCRVGTGAASLDTSATAVFLDEFTPDGTFVSTVAMPTAPSGLHYALTNSGTNTSECQITRSADGRYIIVAGYQQLPGVANVSSSPGRRVFARVDAAGSVDTTTATTSFASSAVRTAASVDGSGFWSGGSSGGIFYSSFGAIDSAVQVSTTVTNNRVINIFDGQLYTSGRTGSYRIGTVGSGTPTTNSHSMTHLLGYSLSDNSVGFFMADLSPSVSGVDTIYVADEGSGTGANGSGVKKFSLVAGTWTYNGTFPLSSSPSIPASGFLGLTGVVTSGSTVTLFATRGATAANQLVKFVDSTGYNVAPTAAPTLLRTAAANTAFRGVALAPEVVISTPSVVTNAATDLAPNSVTLNGTANPGGSTTTGYFRWSATDPVTCNDSFGTRAPASGGADLGSGTTNIGYSLNVTGLTQVTTYYYCAIAQNAGGTSFGSVQSFTTPLPNIAINNVSQSEGNAGTTSYTFAVSLSAPAGPGGVTFDIATADGTAQDDTPSTEDEDYVANSLIGQTILQGSTSYQFTVSVNGDSDVEGNEAFFVNLTSVAGASVADGQGMGTIVNDDAGPLNFIVTKAGADANDGVCDADCSLREAVAAANLNSGADTITFDPALVAAPLTLSLTGGPLTITDDVSITGPGAELLTLNGSNIGQIFIIGTGATVEISGMSMTGGYADDEGGAIVAAGNLTLRAVHMYGNYAPFGGAVSGHEVTAVLNIIDSTIANNNADDAGAIVAKGTFNLINSTVSGNIAADFVGAIYIAGASSETHSIKNSTITDNSARSDGGIWSDAPSLEIGGSIIAGNGASVGSADIIAAVVNSLGYNLIGVVDSASWFSASGDQKGTAGTPLDPMLSPLTNNGGAVPTHAFDLSAGLSPAIDAGSAFGLTLDARGFQRTVDFSSIANATAGDGTDIGAYELLAPTAAPVKIKGRVLTSAGRPLHKALVTLTGPDGSKVSTATDARGNFRFDGVDGGEGYVLSVTKKRYRFDPVFVSANADVAGLEIYAK